MPIVRVKLDANTVYPTNLRYNPDTDTVQSLINGTWTDNPQADPRTQTTFPARITANPACDAAKSVSEAIKAQIDQTIEAVNNAKTAFTIAGLILGLFTFGLFDIFVAIALAIANVMIDAGGTALSAALTPTTFDTLTCILYCQFGSNGRLKPGGLAQAMSDVSDQIGGLGATILNAMLALAGEGGINNLAAQGTATGDCSACDCGIDCGAPELVTIGTVLEEYIEDGRRVLRVQSAAFSTFQNVSIGIYGQPAGDYPCCHIFAWTTYFGSVTETGYTTCPGVVVDPGNPETHDVAHATWNTSPGDSSPFIINIVFGA